MTFKNKINKNYIIKTIILIIATSIFLSFPIMVSPDSALYYWYTTIFEGATSFSDYNALRGPVMGITIFLSRLISKKYGFLILTCIFYLITIIFSYKILDIIKFKNKKLKIISDILFTAQFQLTDVNPLRMSLHKF